MPAVPGSGGVEGLPDEEDGVNDPEDDDGVEESPPPATPSPSPPPEGGDDGNGVVEGEERTLKQTRGSDRLGTMAG